MRGMRVLVISTEHTCCWNQFLSHNESFHVLFCHQAMEISATGHDGHTVQLFLLTTRLHSMTVASQRSNAKAQLTPGFQVPLEIASIQKSNGKFVWKQYKECPTNLISRSVKKWVTVITYFLKHGFWNLKVLRNGHTFWGLSGRFHICLYYIDKSVSVENRPLVKFIRTYIRDLSGVFSISSLVH